MPPWPVPFRQWRLTSPRSQPPTLNFLSSYGLNRYHIYLVNFTFLPFKETPFTYIKCSLFFSSRLSPLTPAPPLLSQSLPLPSLFSDSTMRAWRKLWYKWCCPYFSAFLFSSLHGSTHLQHIVGFSSRRGLQGFYLYLPVSFSPHHLQNKLTADPSFNMNWYVTDKHLVGYYL